MRGSVLVVAVLAASSGVGLLLSGCSREDPMDPVHPIYTGPLPTATRTPTVAENVAHDIRRAGASIKVTISFSAERDPDGLLGKPGGYVAKTAFMDLGLDSAKLRGHGVFDLERGGWVEVFESELAARERAARLQTTRPSGEYDVISGRVLVRLSPFLPSDAVREYERHIHEATDDPVRRVRPA